MRQPIGSLWTSHMRAGGPRTQVRT